MALEQDDLTEINDLTFKEILNNLLDDENLELKTHIFKPKQLASLNMFADLLELYKFPKTSGVITKFIKVYLTYMVSYKRESRKEIIKALTHLLEDENPNKKSMSDSLN